jgi:hypothetical protein
LLPPAYSVDVWLAIISTETVIVQVASVIRRKAQLEIHNFFPQLSFHVSDPCHYAKAPHRVSGLAQSVVDISFCVLAFEVKVA